MLTLLSPEAALAAWPDIASAAHAPRPGVDLDVIHERLNETTLQAWRATGEAEGFILTSFPTTKDTDRSAMWLYLVGGRVRGLKAIQSVVTFFEGVALHCDCNEIRAEVYRPKILRLMPPGWEQAGMVDGRYVLRKELTNA